MVPAQEVEALAALYDACGGESWAWRSNEERFGAKWNFTVDESTGELLSNPCSTSAGSKWQGVSCTLPPIQCSNQTCSVTELILADYSLTGTIPPEMGNLSSLKMLNLYSNFLTGTMPSELENLSRLEILLLDDNQLSGSILLELMNLSQLVSLNIDKNLITGTIPQEIGNISKLKSFSSDYNQISGTIPPAFGELSVLKSLDLDINLLTGTIPTELGKLLYLETLSLDNNHISGTIPVALGNNSNLVSLSTDYNLLTGTIPADLGKMSKLESLSSDNNRISGTIPSELGNLSGLDWLAFENNQITGTLPLELSNLLLLQGLVFGNNLITGPIPRGIENIMGLKLFDFHENQLTGSIPPELRNINNLWWLYIGDNLLTGKIPPDLAILNVLDLRYNRLTGSIPPELGNNNKLAHIRLNDNQLTNTIPSELNGISSLESLNVEYNYLTGTIPPELGSITSLTWLLLDENQLTGTIAPELFNLNRLVWLELDSNLLSGTVPSGAGNLQDLEALRLNDNFLVGTIPLEMGSLSHLRILYLLDNQLTGTLPPQLANMSPLGAFDLSRNYLTGNIPSALSKLSLLYSLDFSNNALSGSLPSELYTMQLVERLSLFGNRFTGVIPSSLSELTNLKVFDVGDNLLTGTVPPDLEQLSLMKSFVLSVNCLDNLIPESVCGMRSVEVLSLNGLGSADDCANRQFVLPFGSTLVYGGNKDGTIPDCIWTLPNLTLFHAAGNGLVGHIRDGQQAAPNTRIADLIVSHNILDGSIPFVSDSLQHLDVSYNRLTGELVDTNSVNVSLEETSMIAQVNRLSGRVPAAMKSVSDLNVLSGNMMSCETVPSNDVHSEGYSCGSSQYDTALYCMGCSVSITAVVIAIMILTRSSLKVLKSQPIMTRNKCEEAISRWTSDLIRYRSFILVVFVAIVVTFMPLLILRTLDGDHTYTTHWHIYSWVVSYSFADGAKMGYLIVMMWVIVLLLTWYFVYNAVEGRGDEAEVHDSRSRESKSAEESGGSSGTQHILPRPGSAGFVKRKCRSWALISAMFTANFILIGGINALYVLSITEASLSQSVRLLVQFGMSLFRIVTSATLVPWLSMQVPGTGRRVFFRVGLLLFNNLVVPCLVTSMTSSNCFQELLVPPDSIESTYSFPTCFSFSISPIQRFCALYGTVQQDTPPFTPRFVYNYQCMSTLLAAYIPVLLVAYCIQLLLTAAAVVALELQVIRFEAVPGAIRRVLHGLLWPQYWISRALESDECPAQEPSQLLRADSIICIDIVNPLALLLTFGLSSPPLAALITLVVVSRMTMWRWAVFRFVAAVKSAGDRLEGRCDELLAKLSEACSPLDAPISWSFSMLVSLSMLFTVFMWWDTTAEVSWEVPLLALLLVMFTAGALRFKGRMSEHSPCQRHAGTEKRHNGLLLEMVEADNTLNPMQKATKGH